MFYTDNPVRDAENYYSALEREAAAWRREHFIGYCPLCGGPMYEDDSRDWVVRDKWLGDECLEYVHWSCYEHAIEEPDEEEEGCLHQRQCFSVAV